jgi:hypothetical protein
MYYFSIVTIIIIIIDTFLGFTKLLVGLGQTSNGYTNQFELIDLETPSSKCKAVPAYPLEVGTAMGGLGADEKPIICGGQASISPTHRSECFTLDSSWTALPSMKTPTSWGQFAPSPFANKSHHLVSSGGHSGQVAFNRMDVLTQQGWEGLTALPEAIHVHCMLLVNSTTLMTIGGVNGNTLNKTWIFHSWSQNWVLGPDLNTARYGHGCAKIR